MGLDRMTATLKGSLTAGRRDGGQATRKRRYSPCLEVCESRQLLSGAAAALAHHAHGHAAVVNSAPSATPQAASLVDRPGVKFWGRDVYDPFVDATSWNANQSKNGGEIGYWTPDDALNAGVRYFVLAHVNYSWSQNALTWGGYDSLAFDSSGAAHIAESIDKIRAAGGDVAISLGGDAGGNGGERPEIARATQMKGSGVTEQKVLEEYERLITTYQLTHVDFNIEGQAAGERVANDLRNHVIARLQSWYSHTYMPGQQLVVTFTIHATHTYVPIHYTMGGKSRVDYANTHQDAEAVKARLQKEGASNVNIWRANSSPLPDQYRTLIRSVLNSKVKVQSFNFMLMHMGVAFHDQTGPNEYARAVRRTAYEIHKELSGMFAQAGAHGDLSDFTWSHMGIVLRPGVDRSSPDDPNDTPDLGQSEILYPGQGRGPGTGIYGTGARSIVNWAKQLKFLAPNHQVLRSGPRYLSIWSLNRDDSYVSDPANAKGYPYKATAWSSGVPQEKLEFSKILLDYGKYP